MTAPTHHCSECGQEIGYMSEPYLCPRTGRQAQPHLIRPRKTTPPQRQESSGVTLRQLLHENAWRPRPQDRAARESLRPFSPEPRRAAGEVSDSVPSTSPAQPNQPSRT